MSSAIAFCDGMAGTFGALLLRAGFHGAIALSLVWLLVRIWPAMPPRIRPWLWRLACLKAIVSLLAFPVLQAPLLPAVTEQAWLRSALVHSEPFALSTDYSVSAPRGAVTPLVASVERNLDIRPSTPRLSTILFLAWLNIAAVAGLRAAASWRKIARIRRTSQPLVDPATYALLAALCGRMGVRRVPELRVAEISTPLITGLLRAAILVPQSAIENTSSTDWAWIFAHELAHVRRGDILWGYLYLAVSNLFFFNPLVWLTKREWYLAQDIACDAEAALLIDFPKADYARLLVSIAAQRNRGGLPALGVMDAYRTLERRLIMLSYVRKPSTIQLALGGLLLTLTALLCLIPWTVTAQTNAVRPIQIAGSAAVAGKVRTPDGKPVKDATVYWIERTADGEVERRFVVDTNADGHFRFADAERPVKGHYVTLLVRTTDWGLTFLPLPATVTAPLAITLEPEISLRVPFTDQQGKPLPKLHIRVSALYAPKIGFLQIPTAMHGRWEQTTDAKGECVFPGLPQGVQVRFAAQEGAFAAPVYDDAIMLGKTATQQAGPITLVIGGVVQGHVTNSEDGKPATGFHVRAQEVGIGNGGGISVTDLTGAYRIVGLRPGIYNVAVFLRGEQQNHFTAIAYEKLEVKPDVKPAAHDFRLIPGSRITGKVTDKSSGQPIADVTVGIYGPAHPKSGAAPGQSAPTGPDGVYHLRVPTGAQYVYVMGLPNGPNDQPKYGRPKEGFNISVEADSSLVQDFTLAPAPAQNLKPVYGRVVGEDGKPVSRAKR